MSLKDSISMVWSRLMWHFFHMVTTWKSISKTQFISPPFNPAYSTSLHYKPFTPPHPTPPHLLIRPETKEPTAAWSSQTTPPPHHRVSPTPRDPSVNPARWGELSLLSNLGLSLQSNLGLLRFFLSLIWFGFSSSVFSQNRKTQKNCFIVE